MAAPSGPPSKFDSIEGGLVGKPAIRALRFVVYDSRNPDTFEGGLAVVSILREFVEVTELRVTKAGNELDEVDQHCRHIVAQIGDAPVGCARWRIGGAPGSPGYVERLVVLKRYRNKKIGSALLRNTLKDMRMIVEQNKLPIQKVMATVPNQDFVIKMFFKQSFKPNPADRDSRMVRMALFTGGPTPRGPGGPGRPAH